MKVTKRTVAHKPKYPSSRQFQISRAVVGAAAIGLGALASGCYQRTGGVILSEPGTPKPPAESEIIPLGGVMVPVSKPRTNDYLVKPGDTLYGIAKQILGKGNRWQEITAINTGLTADTLKAGQTIKVPVP